MDTKGERPMNFWEFVFNGEIPLASYVLFIGFLFLWLAYEIYPRERERYPSLTEEELQKRLKKD